MTANLDNIISYKDYSATFAYNPEKEIFIAKSIKQPEEPFTFEAKSISSLEKEFAELIDSYIIVCTNK